MRKAMVAGLVLLVLSGGLLAVEQADMATLMKKMSHEYKQAYAARQVEEVIPHLHSLQQLTAEAAKGKFGPEKTPVFREGLDKVGQALAAAEQSARQGDMAGVKTHLEEVDALRKHYHKERKINWWKLFFG